MKGRIIKYLMIMSSLFWGFRIYAQTHSDVQLLNTNNFGDETFSKKREVRFLFTKSKNPIVRYNPVSLGLGGLMFVYQKYISVQIGANCPYEVSCSEFSKRCIQQYGLIKGISLGADRLMRCTRLASADLNISDINEHSGRIIDPPSYYQNSRHKH